MFVDFLWMFNICHFGWCDWASDQAVRCRSARTEENCTFLVVFHHVVSYEVLFHSFYVRSQIFSCLVKLSYISIRVICHFIQWPRHQCNRLAHAHSYQISTDYKFVNRSNRVQHDYNSKPKSKNTITCVDTQGMVRVTSSLSWLPHLVTAKMYLLAMWVCFNLGQSRCQYSCEPTVQFGSNKQNKANE